jgi:hypothetical protein
MHLRPYKRIGLGAYTAAKGRFKGLPDKPGRTANIMNIRYCILPKLFKHLIVSLNTYKYKLKTHFYT